MKTHEGLFSVPWMPYGFWKAELFRSFGMRVHDKGFVNVPQSVICMFHWIFVLVILIHSDIRAWRSVRRCFTMFAFLSLRVVRPMFSMSVGHKSNVSAGCKNNFLRRRSFTSGGGGEASAGACWDAPYIIPLHFAISTCTEDATFFSQNCNNRQIQ